MCVKTVKIYISVVLLTHLPLFTRDRKLVGSRKIGHKKEGFYTMMVNEKDDQTPL